MVSAEYQINALHWVLQLVNEVRNLPADEQLNVVRGRLQELSDPPRTEYETLYFLGANMPELKKAEWQRSERIYVMVFGVATIVFLAIIALAVPEPKPFPLFVFRLISSLGAGAVGAFVPGSLTTSIKRPSFTVRAGGALALAVLVWLINPPALTVGH
jgi:hypothetical protein